MPYSLAKSGSGYRVETQSGKPLSKHPLSHDRALAQMRAVYSSEFGKGKEYARKAT
jgi:hypothetical protein